MTTQNIYTLSASEATRITPFGAHSGLDITIQNINNVGNIYIGNEDVSALAFGYRLAPSHAFSVELPGLDDLWVIAEADGLQIAVLSVSLESSD